MLAKGLLGQVVYFKRFRMEMELNEAPPVPDLPPGFSWVPWDTMLLLDHAEAKYLSFRDEIDAIVFPNLGSRHGCGQLMRDIMHRSGFLPEATWLIRYENEFCGTVQGVKDRHHSGGIQNLGIVPKFRGQGLGPALLLKALEGFRIAGLQKTYLEVTAQNVAALRIYRRIGFRCRKTIYKAADPNTRVVGAGDALAEDTLPVRNEMICK